MHRGLKGVWRRERESTRIRRIYANRHCAPRSFYRAHQLSQILGDTMLPPHED